MSTDDKSACAAPLRVGYVVKRYPRYSETFIVNEILAHEVAGLDMEIFALGFPAESHFQNIIALVRAPVSYLMAEGLRGMEFWSALEGLAEAAPDFWPHLAVARGEAARDVYQAALLARHVKERGISLLHAHFATSAASVARLAAHFAGVPYSLTTHAKDIFHEGVNSDDLRRKLEDAAAIVTVSDYNLTYLRDQFGASAAGVQRIYNGLDLARFSYSPSQQREPLVLGIGRLVEKKGFADLLQACAVLKDRGRTFHCRIIGEGEEAPKLHALIERHGLQNTVEMCGERPQNEIIAALREAVVLAAPCVIGHDGNRDGLPTVLLEAMALGTPCISTDVTGIAEAVRPEETGLLVPQADPPALANAIERLLDDPALRARLSRNARRLVEEQFDIARNAAQLRALFEATQQPQKD